MAMLRAKAPATTTPKRQPPDTQATVPRVVLLTVKATIKPINRCPAGKVPAPYIASKLAMGACASAMAAKAVPSNKPPTPRCCA